MGLAQGLETYTVLLCGLTACCELLSTGLASKTCLLGAGTRKFRPLIIQGEMSLLLPIPSHPIPSRGLSRDLKDPLSSSLH